MSEFRYNLSIIGSDTAELKHAIQNLKELGVVPDLLNVDAFSGNRCAYLSTEEVTPTGTISCWDPQEHEKLFHELSVRNPGLLFMFTGEDLDSPNNDVFGKAFQNGLFKEAYQEKQDIDSLLNAESWRKYGEPELQGPEAEAMKLFESISAQNNNLNYKIASDMAYLAENIGLNEPLSNHELYTLASKLQEAAGSWFSEPLLHEEHLDAIRYLLEHGLNEDHSPDFPELSADETRKLLLSADSQVFGTLVEVTAVDNQEYYRGSIEREDIAAIIPAIENARNAKPSLSEQISEAQGKASGQHNTPGEELSQPVR